VFTARNGRHGQVGGSGGLEAGTGEDARRTSNGVGGIDPGQRSHEAAIGAGKGVDNGV